MIKKSGGGGSSWLGPGRRTTVSQILEYLRTGFKGNFCCFLFPNSMIQFQSLSSNSREAAQLQLKGLQNPPSSRSCGPAKVINYRLQPEVKEPSFAYKIIPGLGKGGFLCKHPCVQSQLERFFLLTYLKEREKNKRKRKTHRAHQSCWGSISNDVILSEQGVKIFKSSKSSI